MASSFQHHTALPSLEEKEAAPARQLQLLLRLAKLIVEEAAPAPAKKENETSQGPEHKQMKSEEGKSAASTVPADPEKAVKPWMSEDYEGSESMLKCLACRI